MCQTCSAGYKNMSGYCIEACEDANCAYCSSASNCSFCWPGYQLNSGSKCIKICREGFTPVLDGNCYRCSGYIERCSSCELVNQTGNSTIQCKSCSPGSYLDSGSCTTCNISNCIECSESTICTRCSKDFKVNNGSC